MAVKQINYTNGKIAHYGNGTGASDSLSSTMQLLGIPYQFLPSVDQRVPGISKNIGRKYIENILLNAPILTIIPGKPKYLPGAKDKTSVTNAFIDATNGNFKAIKSLIGSSSPDELKLYDFQPGFVDYYQYVNVLCRSAAGFLDLGSGTGYKINNADVDFTSFDWKNYRWNGKAYKSTTGSLVHSATSTLGSKLSKTGKLVKNALTNANKAVKAQAKADAKAQKEAEKHMTKKEKKKLKQALAKEAAQKAKFTESGINFFDDDVNIDTDLLDACETAMSRKNYIQFYVDSDSASMSHSVSNNTQQSVFKQTLDGASGSSRDLAFLADSGGVDSESIQALGDKALSAISEGLGGALGNVNQGAGSLVQRLLSSGKAVVRGENVMMPDIWSGCDMSQSHTITAHYKAPYGNKLCMYTDVIVPMMHWVALAYPRATTTNSYGSPFLVKAYMPGAWTVNLGCITQLEIKMDVTDGNVNSDGLYTEVDITATITDLYSDMAMTPANNPLLFLNNTSLVNFLGTTCGLNLIQSQLKEKASLIWNNTISNIKDTPSNVMDNITQNIDNIIMNFTGL